MEETNIKSDFMKSGSLFLQFIHNQRILIVYLIAFCIVGLSSTTLVYGVKRGAWVTTKNIDSNSGKSELYRRFEPKNPHNASYPGFEVSRGAYKLSGLTLLFGSYVDDFKNGTLNDYGFRLIALNAKGEIVFKSSGALDSRSYEPIFFKLDSKSPFFILVENGDESGSYGNNVFSVSDGVIKELGYMELSVFKRQPGEFVYNNIGEVTEIVKRGNSFRFNFNADTIIYDHGGKNGKYLQAKNSYYLYENNDFKFLEK
jgi:hypothetical protein